MEKVFVLCVSKEDPHTDEAQLVHCSRCNRLVWISIHNLDKTPVCLPCVVEAMEKGTEDFDFKLALPDIIEAFNHLVKTGQIKLE